MRISDCDSDVCSSDLNELRTEHLKCMWVELLIGSHDCPQHGDTPDVAVIEDLDDVSFLVAKAEVGFIDDERPAKGIERVEDRRDGGGTTGEERLVAERARSQEEPGFAGPELAAQSEVWNLVEGIDNPRNQENERTAGKER